MSESQEKVVNASVAAKSVVWYTVCKFLFKAVTFLTTPFFARLLTKQELGDYSNYMSWILILGCLMAWDLQSSIIRSKLDFDEDINSYVFSILVLTTVVTGAFYISFLLFPDFYVGLLNTDKRFIHVMFAYLFFTPAYDMLITKQRAYYHYKMFVFLTGLTIISSTGLSLLLVFIMDDRYAGRVYGSMIPYIVIGLIIYIYLATRGGKVKMKYWAYATQICLPLVPHLLSYNLLSTSDKIILTEISGAEYTAIYSIAYNCYAIAVTLFSSMIQAIGPWLMDNLHQKNYPGIRKSSNIFFGIFAGAMVGLLLLVPEIIWIFGGKQYMAAIYCLPPLLMSIVFQFAYTLYVNVEMYMKKTGGVAMATMAAAAVNVGLNYLLIPLAPKQGYVIAAYTTLVGYALMLLFHYALVRRMKMHVALDLRTILIILAAYGIIAALMNGLYGMSFWIRYGLVVIYGVAVIYMLYKYKDQILKLFGRKKKTT